MIWVFLQWIEERHYYSKGPLKKKKKHTRRRTRNSSWGKKRRVMIDLPLPKAAKSRSLEGISPKWPNFPKIVLWRPKRGEEKKKVENQNKTTSTQPQSGCASELRSHFSRQSARSRAAAARPGRRAAAPPRTPTHTCLGRGPSPRLPVAALANATTLQLRSPPKSNHIQASGLPLPCSGSARGGSEAPAPR